MAARSKTKRKTPASAAACNQFLVSWIDHDPETGLLQGSGGCIFVSAPSMPAARTWLTKQYPGCVLGVTLCGCCLPDLLAQMEQLTVETKLGERQFYLILRMAGIEETKPWHENEPDHAASQPMMLPALDADEALRYARGVARPRDLPYAALTMEELRSGMARPRSTAAE